MPELGLGPTSVLDGLLGGISIRAFVRDVAQDYDIWANKRYSEPAALAEGDGPIGKYRRWARQFYTSGVGAENAV